MSTIPHTIKRPVSSESYERIVTFLQDNPVGVLSTVDADNCPHGVVVYFATDDNLHISFVTKVHTKKHADITQNNNVMITVFERESQTSVQIKGTAVNITRSDAAKNSLSNIFSESHKTSTSGIPPIAKLVAGNYVTYKVEPICIDMAVYARPDSGGYEMFESLEFIH